MFYLELSFWYRQNSYWLNILILDLLFWANHWLTTPFGFNRAWQSETM